MIAERPYSSTQELFRDVKSSAARGERRDHVVDSEAFLKLENIKWRTKLPQHDIPDIPTLVVPNHYKRSWMHRGWPPSLRKTVLTTRESLITTSIISVEMSKLLSRKTTWLAKSEISEKFLIFKSEDRKMQRAITNWYNFIPADSNPQIVCQRVVGSLEAGVNVGLYPAVKPSQRPQPASKDFKVLIGMLNRERVSYQILPVSIFYEDGEFVVIPEDVVDPKGSHKEIAQQVMDSIGSRLPRRLR